MMTIFEYRCLDKTILGTLQCPTTVEGNREATMLIKFSVTDDQLLQVPSGKLIVEIWEHLKALDESFDKSCAFLLNQLFSIMMDERIS